MKFEQWIEQVDEIMIELVEIDSGSTPDWDWWDTWNEGVSPMKAVRQYLRTQGVAL